MNEEQLDVIDDVASVDAEDNDDNAKNSSNCNHNTSYDSANNSMIVEANSLQNLTDDESDSTIIPDDQNIGPLPKCPSDASQVDMNRVQNLGEALKNIHSAEARQTNQLQYKLPPRSSRKPVDYRKLHNYGNQVDEILRKY